MSFSDHWKDQGRQKHGWFGHGAGPHDDSQQSGKSSGDLFASENVGARIDFAAHSVIGHWPCSPFGAEAFGGIIRQRTLGKLRTAVAAWYGASALSRDAFRDRLLDPYTSDKTMDRLRSAARDIVEARTEEELTRAGENLAAAVQQIGLDRWPRYLADADRRAVEAVSNGEISGVVKASAAGADSAAGIVVGGLILLYLMSRSRQSDRGTPPRALPGAGTSPHLPTIVRAVPVPPFKEGETVADVLEPGSQPVGEPGSDDEIRELPGTEENARKLAERLSRGGTDVTPAGHPGKLVQLPTGGYIVYRPVSDSGPPTTDVNVPGVQIEKPQISGKVISWRRENRIPPLSSASIARRKVISSGFGRLSEQ